jgi:hypothetical protein
MSALAIPVNSLTHIKQLCYILSSELLLRCINSFAGLQTFKYFSPEENGTNFGSKWKWKAPHLFFVQQDLYQKVNHL